MKYHPRLLNCSCLLVVLYQNLVASQRIPNTVHYSKTRRPRSELVIPCAPGYYMVYGKNSSDRTCCLDRNNAVVKNRFGELKCRERPVFCGRGQFLDPHRSQCSPCKDNTFMPLDYHIMRECWDCQTPAEDFLPLHAVIVHRCNRTHPTLLGCEEGYVIHYSKLSTTGNAEITGQIACRRVCGEGEYHFTDSTTGEMSCTKTPPAGGLKPTGGSTNAETVSDSLEGCADMKQGDNYKILFITFLSCFLVVCICVSFVVILLKRKHRLHTNKARERSHHFSRGTGGLSAEEHVYETVDDSDREQTLPKH